MSAQEKALRDLVISKVGELRTEISRLTLTVAAVEKEVRSQPLAEPLHLDRLSGPLRGWIQSMMESVAVIGMCGDPDGRGSMPLRFEVFARDLNMSLNNRRFEPDRSGPRRGDVALPNVPAKTLKGHEDVRQVLSARNGKPVAPMQVYPPQRPK